MKRFILKSLLYLAILLGLHYAVAWQADGFIDPYYLRFANGSYQSMILGTSRAAQGLVPAVFQEELGSGYAGIGNYSFTLSQSPYGPVYLESIQKKMNRQHLGKKRVFLITVDPWSISNFKNPEDDSTRFRENDQILAEIDQVAVAGKPNFEYLRKRFANAWGSMLFHFKTTMEVHTDGWLEVSIPMDSGEVAKRTKARIRAYTEDSFPYYTFSPTRYEYLQKTIDFLQAFGEVYLIRLPVHPELKELEEKFMPDFDQKICALTQICNILYWDFTVQGGKYIFTDGNHLYKESALKISRNVAEKIKTSANNHCTCQ